MPRIKCSLCPLQNRPEGNPFTFLAEAYKAGHPEECLDILTNIYFYLCRKAPSRTLRKQWKTVLRNDRLAPLGLQSALLDFEIKKVGGKTWPGCYHLRLWLNREKAHDDCCLEYSNEAHAMGIDGDRNPLERRACQLMGIREEEKK